MYNNKGRIPICLYDKSHAQDSVKYYNDYSAYFFIEIKMFNNKQQ